MEFLAVKIVVWIIFTGPEYGTIQAGWKSICVEADQKAELHFKIKDDLVSAEKCEYTLKDTMIFRPMQVFLMQVRLIIKSNLT